MIFADGLRKGLAHALGVDEQRALDTVGDRAKSWSRRSILVDEVLKRVIERASWTVHEVLADDAGALARIHCPTYRLGEGECSAVIFGDSIFSDLSFDDSRFDGASFAEAYFSWRGMRIAEPEDHRHENWSGCIVEFDYFDQRYGNPDVTRGSLEHSDLAIQFKRKVAAAAEGSASAAISTLSKYTAFNAAYRAPWTATGELYWPPKFNTAVGARWAPVRAPAVVNDDRRSAVSYPSSSSILWSSNDGAVAVFVKSISIYDGTSTEVPASYARSPDRLCLLTLDDKPVSFAEVVMPGSNADGPTQFPCALESVLAAPFGERYTLYARLNEGHVLGARVPKSDRRFAVYRLWSMLHTPPDEWLADRPSAVLSIQWLVATLMEATRKEFRIVREHWEEAAVSLLSQVIVDLGGHPRSDISAIIKDGDKWVVRRITADGITEESADAILAAIAKEPGYQLIGTRKR